MSKGIISAVRENYKTSFSEFDAIQVDAAINPGNSGGAIFSDDGRLIGMSCFIITRTGMSHGLNFGIHIKHLTKAVNDALYAEDNEDILRGEEVEPKEVCQGVDVSSREDKNLLAAHIPTLPKRRMVISPSQLNWARF